MLLIFHNMSIRRAALEVSFVNPATLSSIGSKSGVFVVVFVERTVTHRITAGRTPGPLILIQDACSFVIHFLFEETPRLRHYRHASSIVTWQPPVSISSLALSYVLLGKHLTSSGGRTRSQTLDETGSSKPIPCQRWTSRISPKQLRGFK